MERRGGNVKPFVLVGFLMVLIIGAECSPASEFESCYVGCFILCVILPSNTVFGCSVKCLKDCIPSPLNLKSLGIGAVKEAKEYFCKLGCASSSCTSFSTKQNPSGKKVADCVDSCSGTCS